MIEVEEYNLLPIGESGDIAFVKETRAFYSRIDNKWSRNDTHDVIDNFEKFGFEFVEGEFYFFQILNRNKSGGDNKTRCIKSYYIDSAEYLAKKKPEMIQLALTTDSRIYCHPARRNKNRIALELLSYVADCISTNTNNKIRRSYETVCGRNGGVEKMRIVDVDSKDTHLLNGTISHIANIRPNRSPRKILPTVNGYHLIYKGGFDMSQYDGHRDVHKNNPTVVRAMT